ncbi:MAG: ATP-binding protein [Methylotenera sp.]|nr:ATP-binding protein [Methylotenera sp.]
MSPFILSSMLGRNNIPKLSIYDNQKEDNNLSAWDSNLLCPSRRNLERLFILRTVMAIFLLSVAAGLLFLHIPLPKLPIAVGLSGMMLLNLITWLRLKNHRNISDYELFAQLLGDLIALTVLFYFSGGYSNPLVWMYLLPLTIAAVALHRVFTWLLALLAVVCYSVLVFYFVPLSHLHMHYISERSLDIHLVGMWLGFIVSTGIIAFFITRIGQSLRDYDRTIATIREKSLESEFLLSLGSLATSAAHELGTPLATMAVVNTELSQDLKDKPEQLQQVEIMRTQIERCKEILSSITRNAGQSRAEAGHGITLRDFIQEAIQRWRDTRPATELVVTQNNNTANPIIFTDRMLMQGIQNMLDNAADASPERILLDVEWNEKSLQIKIRDFGTGLTEVVKKQLGKPFFTLKENQGMGLGVFLTKATLARFGGELTLRNHSDGGVLTLINLPLKNLRVSK